MTADEVRRAVHSAAREAFNLGAAAAQSRGKSSLSTEREKAQTYAEDLVMPMAEMAIEDAREQGFLRAKSASSGAS